MHTVQFEITKPTDDAAFEDMCANIYGAVFDDPLPQTNGRRGQAQGGIDVFIDAPEGRIGVQCKKYADGALKFKHVAQEVSLADKAKAPIVRLIVATTATSDASLLREVQDLSDSRVSKGLHPVALEFWQDLCRHIQRSSKLQNDYAPNAPGAVFHRQEEQHAEQRATLLSIDAKLESLVGLPLGRADSVNKYITRQLDDINDLLRAGRFKDAQEDLQRIGADITVFDDHQRARWLVQRGVCTWHLDSGASAAPDFLKAAEIYPDDEKIAAAKVRGLLFLDRVDDALAFGKEALDRFPASAHVWIAHANANMVKGIPVRPTDAPAAMRENGDVLQLLAWASKKAGDVAGAVELSAKALDQKDAGFFVRSTALVLALEAAAIDPVQVGHGLVSDSCRSALQRAVDALTPRKDWVWSVQSPESVQDTLVHLGYSYLVLGRPEEALELVDEARHADVLSPRLKRVALEAHQRLGHADELLRLGRGWLDDLEEEALVLVAEHASVAPDVALVEAVQAVATQKGVLEKETLQLLQAMRWIAMWRSGTAQQEVVREVRAADLANTDSLPLICGGARILHAVNDETATEAAIARARTLVNSETPSPQRLLLADLLFATGHFDLAAQQYEVMAVPGRHSELHSKLLHCYLRTGSLRKAKELIRSLPDNWMEDERSLRLAIELGQQASDWEFLVPLAELHCQRRPFDAGAWFLRLALDLKMRRMARFHLTLESVPSELTGPTRLIAQVASCELRYGRKNQGIRRLYGLFRRRLDDLEAASAYVIAIVAGPPDLPFMEGALTTVRAGSTVTLRNDLGGNFVLSVDPEGFDELPPRDGFVSPTSETAHHLLGVEVGQPVTLPGSFGVAHSYVVEGVTTVFRGLLQIAQERVNSPVAAGLPIVPVPVPMTDSGADFSHVHAMLKRQSEHSRRALQAYAESPITLGILSRLLGKSVVDIVSGWPSDAPPLFVCSGTVEQRKSAVARLKQADSEFVIDAATVAELASLDCLGTLAALPRVYISTKAVETLELRLAEAKIDREGGQLLDDNGTMRFVEYTARDRERQVAYFQRMVDAAREYCTVLPAYGPESMPPESERWHDVLEDEEHAVLLLAAEKRATLLTIDGKLAHIGAIGAGIDSVWPQELIRHAAEVGRLPPQDCAFAVVRMFLRNRSFVSLAAFDLVFMCWQGGYALTEGIQKFKEYLSAGTTDHSSALTVAFEFLELQAQYPTQFGAFAELLGHVLEAALRHPHCNRETAISLARRFVHGLTLQNNGPFVAYEPAEDFRQARMRVYERILMEAIASAAQLAELPARRRAIRLRALKCRFPPYLAFDGEATEPEEPSLRTVDTSHVDPAEASETEATFERIHGTAPHGAHWP